MDCQVQRGELYPAQNKFLSFVIPEGVAWDPVVDVTLKAADLEQHNDGFQTTTSEIVLRELYIC
jgi:hypothetical protein